jgi:hypothetical protein
MSERARAIRRLGQCQPWPEPSSATVRTSVASALEDLGRRRADTEDAVQALGEALGIYAACGAAWDSSRVRGRLPRSGFGADS